MSTSLILYSFNDFSLQNKLSALCKPFSYLTVTIFYLYIVRKILVPALLILKKNRMHNAPCYIPMKPSIKSRAASFSSSVLGDVCSCCPVCWGWAAG